MTTSAAVKSPPTDLLRLDVVAYGLLLTFIVALHFSIAAADILLTAALIAWAALLVKNHERPTIPGMFWPLGAYAAWTMVSTIFSLEPGTSWADDKQLMLFLIVPL